MTNLTKTWIVFQVLLVIGCVIGAIVAALNITPPETPNAGYYALHLVNPFVLVQTALIILFNLNDLYTKNLLQKEESVTESCWLALIVSGGLGLIVSGLIWGFKSIPVLPAIYDIVIALSAVFAILLAIITGWTWLGQKPEKRKRSQQVSASELIAITGEGEMETIALTPAERKKVKEVLGR